MIHIHLNLEVRIETHIYTYSRKSRKESTFLIGLFCNFGWTGPFLTEFWEPALWKCSYGPWDDFQFSVTNWFRLCFYQSDPAFSRKHQFPDYCILAEFHNLQVGRRLALEERFVFLGECVHFLRIPGSFAAVRRYHRRYLLLSLPLFAAICRLSSPLFATICRHQCRYSSLLAAIIAAIRHYLPLLFAAIRRYYLLSALSFAAICRYLLLFAAVLSNLSPRALQSKI